MSLRNDRLEWLIRKDGCMHCTEPGCLKKVLLNPA